MTFHRTNDFRIARSIITKMFWDPTSYTDDENLRWALLRAIEWRAWPFFITQPIVPLLFIFYKPEFVVIILLIIGIAWNLVSMMLINLNLMYFGPIFVKLRWFSSIGVGGYLIYNHVYLWGILALLWPIVVGSMSPFLAFGTTIGKMQERIMNRLGYHKNKVTG